MPSIYHHDYHPLSIYGNVVSLLQEHRPRSGVHLDIGCGYGAIAEPIRDELGLTYIGLDLADDGLESLRERGFETHRIDLYELDRLAVIVREAIANRPIASLTFMDTLEHITNGEEVLSALRRIAKPVGAPLVLSVPNVTHKDLALKLLFGRWDVTDDGLLDHTHVTLYSHERLSELMQAVGWRKIATRDWPLHQSDQYFPVSSPLLNRYLPAGQFLDELINRANPHAIVNQFVRLYQVDEPQPRSLLVRRGEPPGPFLSVVLSAAADRLSGLRTLAQELELQSSGDFELVLLYPPSVSTSELSDGIFAGLPSVGARVRFVPDPGGTRVDALNAAVERASGRYFAILDDAGGVAPNWIDSLIALSERLPGAVLQVNRSDLNGAPEPPSADYGTPRHGPVLLPEFYRFVREKHGPFATLAIPASVFRQLGLRFGLPLPDGNGWDLAVDAILHCGLSTSPAMTVAPIANAHPASIDLLGTEDILLLKRLNDRPLLLPIGSAERIEALAEWVGKLEAENARLVERLEKLRRWPVLSQLIDVYAPCLTRELRPVAAETPNRPFLSVITRTQGQRPFTLRDTLMSLAGQSCQDFEVIVVVHSDSEPLVAGVRAIALAFPPSLRERISIITCTRPGRSSPLNDGVRQAKGHYIALLDDDDIALGHWVETFQDLAAQTQGAVLRAICVRQNFELTTGGDLPTHPRAVSWFDVEWPAIFDPVKHLHSNFTPPMCLAYPAEVFCEDGLEFDESMNTTEDWDLTMRASMLRGVVTTPEVTAIYCWGRTSASSLDIHPSEEWADNAQRIRDKLNAQPLLLPSGSALHIVALFDTQHQQAVRINDLQELHATATKQVGDLQELHATTAKQVGELTEEKHQLAAQNQWMAQHLAHLGALPPEFPEDVDLGALSRLVLISLLTSRSWRVSQPLRWVMRLLSGRLGENCFAVDNIPPSLAERQQLIREMTRSTSWRIAFPLRVVGHLLRRVRR